MKSKQFFMRVSGVCACVFVHDSFFTCLFNIYFIYVCMYSTMYIEMLSLLNNWSVVAWNLVSCCHYHLNTLYGICTHQSTHFFPQFLTHSVQYHKQSSNSESEISADVVSFCENFRKYFCTKVCFEKKIQKCMCRGCKWRRHSKKCVYFYQFDEIEKGKCWKFCI